jgi:hypothetical protein
MRIDEIEQSSGPINLAVLVNKTGGSMGLTPIKDGSGLWASRAWYIDRNKYPKLIGGTFSVHSGQSQPSHFGGEIVRVDQDEEHPDRGVIIFKPSVEIKNGSIGGRSLNWGQEKAYY